MGYADFCRLVQKGAFVTLVVTGLSCINFAQNVSNILPLSGVTIGRARRAVHAGPALWGPKICPTLFLKKVFLGKRGPFWNTCTLAHCNLVTPLLPLNIFEWRYCKPFSNAAVQINKCVYPNFAIKLVAMATFNVP